MPERPEVSIVIPCLNEITSIRAVVRGAQEALDRLGYEGEIIVCDNGSTDGSRHEVEGTGARVVRQPIRGYGAACLRGIEAAPGRKDPEKLAAFFESLRPISRRETASC